MNLFQPNSPIPRIFTSLLLLALMLAILPYHKPQLEKLGDLRALTLGTSPGVPDSGGGSIMEGDGTYNAVIQLP